MELRGQSTGFYAQLGKMCLQATSYTWHCPARAPEVLEISVQQPVGVFVRGGWSSAVIFLLVTALCPMAAGGGEGLPHRACRGGVLCGWRLPGGGVQRDQPGDGSAAEARWGTDVQHWQYLQPFLHH